MGRTVLKFFRDRLKLDMNACDIMIAHRLRKGAKETHRPVIVRLANKTIRDNILRSKKILSETRTSDERIFVSEHLTRSASNLFFEARKCVRDKKLASAWTMNGKVYCKTNPDDRPKHIASINDLP